MTGYSKMSKPELEAVKAQLQKEYEAFQAKGLKLDMSRGKPGSDQLDLSTGILGTVDENSGWNTQSGVDCRNYGVLDGIPEMKKLFADFFEVDTNEIIIGGNSSLNLMFDYVSQAMTHGTGAEPWMKQGNIKFLCPVPGYDRHFGILEYFGIEMINIDTLEDGPDMEAVEAYVKDPMVKGMICVPKYTNPEGKTYNNKTVRRLAALKPAAKDFRIIWDNAYAVHDLTETPDGLLNLLEECKKTGNDDMPVMFASTSKISFPGAGVSAIAASRNNVSAILKRMGMQTIGYDKLNQLRHVRYFKNLDGIRAQMKRHADIIAPKFQVVLDALEKELAPLEIAQWVKPNGGYFISLNVMDGCANRVVELCKRAGVVLTPAGATYPYGKDPKDRNIRIAPTYPPVEELELAVSLLCLCTKLAAAEKLLAE